MTGENNKSTHLSLFSGIGGLDIAADWKSIGRTCHGGRISERSRRKAFMKKQEEKNEKLKKQNASLQAELKTQTKRADDWRTIAAEWQEKALRYQNAEKFKLGNTVFVVCGYPPIEDLTIINKRGHIASFKLAEIIKTQDGIFLMGTHGEGEYNIENCYLDRAAAEAALEGEK